MGTVLTLGASQFWIIQWSESGQRFSIGAQQEVEIPENLVDSGDLVLVYYESPHSVPPANCTIAVTNPYGERIQQRVPTNDRSYRVSLTGWSGRCIAELDIPEAGVYRFLCSNANFRSDDEIPAEDRVVFLKSPQDLDEVRAVQKIIKILGGVITVALGVILYVIHGLKLRKAAG